MLSPGLRALRKGPEEAEEAQPDRKDDRPRAEGARGHQADRGGYCAFEQSHEEAQEQKGNGVREIREDASASSGAGRAEEQPKDPKASEDGVRKIPQAVGDEEDKEQTKAAPEQPALVPRPQAILDGKEAKCLSCPGQKDTHSREGAGLEVRRGREAQKKAVPALDGGRASVVNEEDQLAGRRPHCPRDLGIGQAVRAQLQQKEGQD